jgi:uncharacterized protein YbjT (DUF2867 family)
VAETILVTGGTGTLGRVVVRGLMAAGCQVRVLSRRPPAAAISPATWVEGDLRRGTGLAEALEEVATVVHCATGRRDTAMTGQLVRAAEQQGCQHLVYVSIVGIDQVPLGYYQAKLASERLVEASAVPCSILRATQFHDLAVRLFDAVATVPVMAVPAIPLQPIDVRDVAPHLVEAARGEPRGRLPDIGGPEVRRLPGLARAYLAARRRRRAIVPLLLPGRTFAAYRHGGHLAPGRAAGVVTFEQYLQARFADI